MRYIKKLVSFLVAFIFTISLGTPAYASFLGLGNPGWVAVEFKTATSSNWTVPANVYKVYVTLVAGGGCGGGVLLRWLFTVTPGSSIPYTVGAGGIYTGPTGGGSTQFGQFTAQGGLVGASTSSGANALGGAGGTAMFVTAGAVGTGSSSGADSPNLSNLLTVGTTQYSAFGGASGAGGSTSTIAGYYGGYGVGAIGGPSGLYAGGCCGGGGGAGGFQFGPTLGTGTTLSSGTNGNAGTIPSGGQSNTGAGGGGSGGGASATYSGAGGGTGYILIEYQIS